MSPFLHDLANPATNVSTDDIRRRLATEGSRRHALAVAIITNGRAHPYFLPHRWSRSLMGPDPELDDKIFAFGGELVANCGHTVVIPTDTFSLLTNQVQVATVPQIQSSIAAGADLQWMGPYAPNDGDTMVVKSRRIIPIPHSMVGLFLAQPNGVTPRYYFETIYPQLVTDGIADDCLSMTHFFQIAITRKGNNQDESFLETTQPSAPNRNPTLIKHQLELLHHHFPQLSTRAVSAGNTLIAQGLGTIAAQQQLHYDKVEAAKVEEKSKTIEKWMGASKCHKLLRMTGTRNEQELMTACPVYKDLAAASDKHRRGVIQNAVDELLLQRGKEHLFFQVSQGLYINFVSLTWHRVHDDSLTTGFLGNLFLFGDTDEEHGIAVNKVVDMALSGDTAMSQADAKKIVDLTINIPLENKSLSNLKRAELLYAVLLPANHPALTFLQAHIAAMDDYSDKWEVVETDDPKRQAAKAIYHLQYLSLHLSRFWKKQAMTNTPVGTLPSPTALIEKIDMSEPWQPKLSTSFERSLKIPELCRLAASSSGGQGTARTMGLTADDMSAITNAEGTVLSRFLQSLNAAGGNASVPGTIGGGTTPASGGGGGTGNNNATSTNPTFSEVLFGQYKNRMVNGRPVKCRDLRNKISRGELPELPLSKVDNAPMCLAWHTKGMCNSDCPRVADHVPYTNEELGPLCTWCGTNYPQDTGGT